MIQVAFLSLSSTAASTVVHFTTQLTLLTTMSTPSQQFEKINDAFLADQRGE
jgi:hypothetical protein